MSLIPSFLGRRPSTIFDQFSLGDPFEGWPFNSDFQQLPDHFRSHLASSSGTASFAGAMVDWRETPNAHVFKADIPGLKKEEVKVELEDDRILQISGERKQEMEQKGDTWHRAERNCGGFLRRFSLPENAKVEEVKASMENGVLTVTVPKVNAKKPDIKSIDISG